MTLIRESVLAREWRPFAIMSACVACVASTALVVDGYKATHKPLRTVLDAPRTITSVGSATRHVVADRVQWELTVSAHAPDERNARRSAMALAEKARALLVDHQVRGAEITVLPVSVEEATRTVVHHTADGSEESDDVPNGFDSTQTLRITSTDVSRIVAAFRLVTSSPQLDMADISEPMCTFSGLAALERELWPEARRAVRQRADAAMKLIRGAHLGHLYSVDIGSFVAPGFSEASVSSCEQGVDATATVTATFELSY